MSLRKLAKILGSRGGLARARRLSSEQRKRIASQGGRTKYLSLRAGQRVERNFYYLRAVRTLRKPPRVKVVSRVLQPLPGIYAREKRLS